MSDPSDDARIGDSRELPSPGDADAVKRSKEPQDGHRIRTYANVAASEVSRLPKDPVKADNRVSSSCDSSVSEGANFLKDPVKPVIRESNSPDVPASRVARASQDELSAVIDELAVAARVITAISFQNGLIDGSISPDTAAAELLNIKTAELTQLTKFDRNKIEEFMKKINAIGPSLDADAEILSIEEMILLMNDWRLRYSDVGDLNDVTSADLLLTAAEQMKKIDDSSINALIKAATGATFSLQSVPTLKDDTEVIIFSTLTQLHGALKTLADGSKTVATLTLELNKLKDVAENKFATESPQSKFVGLLDDFFLMKNKVDKHRSEKYDTLLKLFSSVSSLTPDAKASEGEMKVVEAVAVSRKQHHDQQHTSGFLNGYSDIGRISSDAKDPHLKTIVHGFDTGLLNSGLKPLQTLMTNAANVDTEWSKFSDNSVRATGEVREISKKLIAAEAPTQKTDFDKIDICGDDKPLVVSSFYDDVNALVKNSTALTTQVDSLTGLSEQIAESLRSKAAELLRVKDAIKFSSDDANVRIKESKAVLAEFAKQSTTEVLAYLQDVTPKLATLKKTIESVSQLLQGFPDIKNVVTALHKATETTKFQTFFSCMTKLPSEFSSASSKIALTQKIREFAKTPGIVQETSKLTTKIDESRDAVDALRKTSAELKGNQDSTVKELTRMGTLANEARILGDSMMALSNVRKILNKKSELQKFVLDGGKVAVAIQEVQDPKTRSALRFDWGDFHKTKDEVGKLLADLKIKRNHTTIPNAARFADYAPIFRAFNGLMDVDLQIIKRLDVLETLSTTNPNMASLKTLLQQELGSLDLYLARYDVSLSAIAGALSTIDGMFASYMFIPTTVSTRAETTTQQMTATQAFFTPLLQLDPSELTTYMMVSTTGNFFTSTLFYGLLAGGSFVFAFAAVESGIYCYRRRKIREPVPVLDPPPKLIPLSTRPNPVPRPTQPDPVSRPTQPDPVSRPTQPDRVPQPTQPNPVLQPTQPNPVLQPTQPNPVLQPTQPDPVLQPTQPEHVPGEVTTQPIESPKPTVPPVEKRKWTCNPCGGRDSNVKRAKTKQRETEEKGKSKMNSNAPPKSPCSTDGRQWDGIKKEVALKEENGFLAYDYGKVNFDVTLFSDILKINAWAGEKEVVNSDNGHSALSDLSKMQLDKTRTLVNQWFDFLAKIRDPTAHAQPKGYHLDMIRGNKNNFNRSSQPTSMTDTNWYCCNIIYFPLYSSMIIAQAPMDGTEQPEEEDEDKDNKMINETANEEGIRKNDDKKAEKVKSKSSKTSSEKRKKDEGRKVDKNAVETQVIDETVVGKKEMEDGKKGEENKSRSKKKKSNKFASEKLKAVEPADQNNVEKGLGNGGKEEGRNDAGGDAGNTKIKKVCTRRNFWHMIYTNKCPHIVQTCGADEICSYYPKSETEPLDYDDYRIEFIKKYKHSYNVIQTVLKVTAKKIKTENEHVLHHWTVGEWKRGETPRDCVDGIVYVLRVTRLTQTPTCVLSVYGTGRAAVFALVEYWFQTIIDQRHTRPRLSTVTDFLRGERYGFIESGRQMFYAHLIAFEYLDWDWSLSTHKPKEEVLFHPKILSNNWKVLKQYNEVNCSRNKRDLAALEKFKNPKDGEINDGEGGNNKVDDRLNTEKTQTNSEAAVSP